MRIFIEDSFDSAHYLPNVPVWHKCHRTHGHTYRIRIEVAGAVDPVLGWVVDYSFVRAAWCVVKDRVDHHMLNEITELENPTCELIAEWIWRELSLPGLAKIELRETEHCGVVYEGEGKR